MASGVKVLLETCWRCSVKNGFTVSTFFGESKIVAFERVWNRALLVKQEAVSVSSCFVDWTSKFPAYWYIRVVLDCTSSEQYTINAAVGSRVRFYPRSIFNFH